MIRFRLTVWNTAVFGLVLTILGVVIYLTTQASLYRAVDDELVNRMEFLERVYQSVAKSGLQIPGDLPVDRLTMVEEASLGPDLAERMAIQRQLMRPRVLYPDGTGFLSPSDRAWDVDAFERSLRGKRQFSNLTIANRQVRIYSVPFISEGKITAVAQSAASVEDVERSVASLGRVLLAMLPLSLLLVWAIGVFLAHRALSPVRQIAFAAERLQASDLTERLPVSGNDELSRLSKTFNGMIDRLQRSFSQLEETIQSQRRFTADASHELKTPITAIKARIGVAQCGEPSPERLQAHLNAIQESTHRMEGIVQDLLLLARNDDHSNSSHWKPVALQRVARQAIAETSALAGPDVELQTEGDPWVHGDQEMLCRCIVNLLSNAKRHTGPNNRIVCRIEQRPAQAMIAVEDEGEGIPPEHLSKLFDRFHRVDPSRDRDSGGTGLGLAIVKSVVERHGGTIHVASEIGLGSRFQINLPLEQTPQAQSKPTGKPERPRRPLADVRPATFPADRT
jgi:heavy metal sensor kinase